MASNVSYGSIGISIYAGCIYLQLKILSQQFFMSKEFGIQFLCDKYL